MPICLQSYTVTLHLNPISSVHIHQKPLVFLLNSPLPLVWKLKTERLAPGIRRVFFVSLGSVVQFEKGNFSLSAETEEKFFLRKMNICYSGPRRNMERALQVDIIVDIKPSQPGARLVRDVVLLLKCRKPVNWVIKSHDVQGKLEVITSNSIGFGKETERSMAMSKSVIPDLPSSHESLIKWAYEHNYSPVISYTKAPVANRFHLQLEDTEEMNDEEDHSLPPELTELLGANPLPAPKNTDGLTFPFHINRGRHDTVGEEIFPSRHSVDTLINHDFGHSLSKHKEPEEVQGSADMALSIKCDDKVMTVAVEKDSLQAGGYTRTELSLLDHSCKARTNGTHFILESALNKCGTRTAYVLNKIVYFNSIVIQLSAPAEGSGLEDDDMESGDNGFPGDADEGEVAFSSWPEIAFNCTLHQPEDDRGIFWPPEPHITNVTFNMELYKTDLFLAPSQGLFSVARNGPVYVEVSVTKADRSLGFAIQTCFVSPFSNPDRMSDYTIIENICPKDESVKFYSIEKENFPIPHAQKDRKRFSFVFKPMFNISLLFLHCELTLCTKKDQDTQGLPKCIPPDEACTSLNVDMILAMMHNKKTFTKPLVIIHEGKQEAVLYGLDTLTVVGIAFAAFVIGALLTGALWFIYSRTAAFREALAAGQRHTGHGDVPEQLLWEEAGSSLHCNPLCAGCAFSLLLKRSLGVRTLPNPEHGRKIEACRPDPWHRVLDNTG
ncbi:hypothetical protein DUI87_14743 [Hirundo rustica rustica]|uniref:ZP domain-containing protein n=1 Tax=Hirundo rustica rustica TaxID=333673 RepID=A0A3M0K5T6_HIRRU|nr:hypothetical protein DUI87_14743 [Hirundo rustica rustica]